MLSQLNQLNITSNADVIQFCQCNDTQTKGLHVQSVCPGEKFSITVKALGHLVLQCQQI